MALQISLATDAKTVIKDLEKLRQVEVIESKGSRLV